jgi:hypothetical protein
LSPFKRTQFNFSTITNTIKIDKREKERRRERNLDDFKTINKKYAKKITK